VKKKAHSEDVGVDGRG